MKILMTSVVDLQKSQHNRPHHFVTGLCRDHDLTIVSINDWWKHDHGYPSYDAEFRDALSRVDYHYLTDRRISPILQEMAFRRPLKNLRRESFDLHINFNTILSGRAAPGRIPSIFDMADDLAAMTGSSPQIPWPLRSLASRTARALIERNIRAADKVTVTLRSLSKAYGIPLHKAEILRNGVDTSLFSPRERERPTIRSIVLGYVGALREWVDLRPVYDALRHLNDAVLTVVGGEGDLDHNRRLADLFRVSDRVSFVGGVPYSEVPERISGMDICLIPFARNPVSRHAFPLKLLEYLSCSKPVIAAPLEGIRTIAGDRILYASSGEDYASHVIGLMDDPGWRRRLGKQGRRLVRKEYSWRLSTEKLRSVIEQALN